MRPTNLADAMVFDDHQFRDNLEAKLQTQKLDAIDIRPKEFEVIDKIYQNELEEIQIKLKSESIKKLKKLNKQIRDRMIKGTEVIPSKALDPD